MAGKAFTFKVDITQVEQFKFAIGRLDPAQLGPALTERLNEIVRDTYVLSRSTMLRAINLTESYVDTRMQVREAGGGRGLTAEIIAKGDRNLMTNLSHYGAMQGVKPVTWDNERISAMGKKFGRWPGWTKRIGDAGRGIGVGDKADKMSAEVTRGSRKSVGQKFTIPGKKDSSGNLLVFAGTGVTGKGKRDGNRKKSRQGVKALYGPSVYQLFRTTAELIEDQVGDNLVRGITIEAERQFQKLLEG